MKTQDGHSAFLEMLYTIQGHILDGLYQGDFNYEGAMNTLQKHLRTADEINNQTLVARTLTMIGIIELERNSYATAESYFNEAHDVYKAVGDMRRVGSMLSNLGEVMRRWGKLEEAGGYYHRAREVAKQTQNKEIQVYIESNEGMLWVNAGQPDRAIPFLKQALALSTNIVPLTKPIQELLSETLNGMARAYIQLGDLNTARDFALQSWEKATETAVVDQMAFAKQTLAQLAMLDPRDGDDVEQLLHESEQNWRRFHSPVELGDFLVIKGDFYKPLDSQLAMQSYQEALECYQLAERSGKVEEMHIRLNGLREGK